MTRRVTLREAARVLGISKEAVRKRVKRNTLAHEKGEDGRVYVSLPEGDVYIPDGGDAGVDAGVDVGGDAGTDDTGEQPDDTRELRDHDDHRDRDELIAELRAEVAAWREESRRKDHIIAALVERLPPQLEAAPEPRQAARTDAETPEGASPRSGTPWRQEGVVRALWRLLFGG